MTGIVVGAVAIAALTIAASPPSSAAAKRAHGNPAAGLFGVHPWEPPSQEEYQRMGAGGVSSIRLLISLDAVSPEPNVRDWRLYDTIIGDAARSGITVDPWFMYLPPWLSADATTLPIYNQTQRTAWYSFVREAALRYGVGGSFWRQNPTLPARPMRFWEVWNEPNLRRVTARQYASLLRLTRSALRSVSPANRTILGGLYSRPKPHDGVRPTLFLRRLYKLRGGRRLFDAVGIHPYASRPMGVLRNTRSAREVMDKYGDRRKPIWITELGWTTGGSYWAQSLYRATLPQQAVRVGRMARLLVANRRKLALRRVDWFTWRDLDGSGKLFWAAYAGLFTADGQPKPAWSAFTQVTGGFTGGQIHTVGHFAIPPGPIVPPGGSSPAPPAPPPQPPPQSPPPPGCVLIIFCH